MNKSILIVEDEERMRKLIGDYLKREGYTYIEASNGIEAINLFKNNNIDLIILDVMMPFLDGFEVCKSIRKNSNTPIIMLTARSEEDDKLLGYEFGADDYITKPFSPKILMAKIKAIFNRVDSINSTENSTFNMDGLVIDELSHDVKVDGQEVILSPKEYELLLYLVKNKGMALTRTQILDSVWGIDYYGDTRTVDTNIKRIREKLGDKADFITTIRGSGYRFEVKK
ncbi:response regulator transcription factor [Clostridium sp. 19966]|uniref:response regulator transcription factor n=1 Tax=Clostridium sp. 19966 TaxID=2768166 RepID=UPI0028DFC291|nr:response regulator transcription factor [Clostridium sp. 19966]MDT8716359.1 response regulator transcription factor [Clostridium sp. 19966]